MATNPFAHLIPTQGQPPAAPPGGEPYTVGTPRPRQPPPQTPTNEQIDQENLERIRLANEAARVQAAQGTAAQAIETERKASAFFIRALGANRDYEGTGVGPRSWVGENMRENAPNLLNALPSAIGNSPERQVSDSAQDEFIAASLRQDSGAAIPEQELERQRRIYFPQPGDGPEAIEQKRRARARALEGLINSAGRSLRQQDREAYDQWRAGSGEAPATAEQIAPPPAEGGPAEGPGDGLVVDITGGRLPETPGEGGEDWQRAFEAARATDPALTFRSFVRRTMLQGRERVVGERGDLGDRLISSAMLLSPATLPLIPNQVAGMLGGGSESMDAATRGYQDTSSLGTRGEIAGFLRTFGGGTMADNIAREDAIDQYDSQNNPLSRFTGQLAGGFALPIGRVTSAGRLAAVGGGYGGAYGFGSGEGSVTDRLISAGEGAVIGATAAGTLGLAANRLSRGGAPGSNRSRATELMAAADRQGLPVIPADVGGPITRGATSGARQLTFGSLPVSAADEALAARFAERAGELAGPDAMAPESFGGFARRSLEGFNQRTSQEGRAAYASARQSAGDEERFIGMEAVRKLDEHIDALRANENTNAPLIAGLDRLRGDLAQPEIGLRLKSIDAMRDLRTSTRAQAATDELRGTDYQRRAGEVLDSLSEDIAADLAPQAAADFRRADAAWRERLSFIDEVEERILGPRNNRTDAQVTQNLIQMSRSDQRATQRLLSNLNAEEQQVFRGSLITEMGTPPPGQAAEGNFSVSTWLTNWNRLTENGRSLDRARLLFGSNLSHAQDLATFAAGVRRGGTLNNSSNTGRAINFGRALGGLASAVGAIQTLGATIPLELITGRLLASQRVARWLARPPQDRGRALRRLSEIAVREPQLAPDIQPIQRILEGGARSAAAEDTENPR